MKRVLFKICSLIICVVMVFGLYIPTTAMASEKDNEENISESIDLSHATIYLEETSDYRVVYIVYDTDTLEYAINRKDGSDTVDYGVYNINSCPDHVEISRSSDVVDFLMSLTPDGTYVVSHGVVDKQRQSMRSSPAVTTTSQALTYASNYGPGYLPTKNENIGNRTRNGVTAYTTERIMFFAYEDFYIDFSAGDLISVILSNITGISLATLLDLIPYAWDYLMRRYATQSGELYMFTVVNDRVKTSRIYDQPWYWAAWDYKFRVYSSTTRTQIEVCDNNMHYDYNENYIYFGDKALDNYFSSLT